MKKKRVIPAANGSCMKLPTKCWFHLQDVQNTCQLAVGFDFYHAMQAKFSINRSALCCVIALRVVVKTCRSFDTASRVIETSVRNYHYSLRNNPEERSFQLLHGGSLKPREIRQTPTRSSVRRQSQTSKQHKSQIYASEHIQRTHVLCKNIYIELIYVAKKCFMKLWIYNSSLLTSIPVAGFVCPASHYGALLQREKTPERPQDRRGEGPKNIYFCSKEKCYHPC